MLSGCLGIPRSRHSNVTHIYRKSQGTASYGNAARFPVIVRTPTVHHPGLLVVEIFTIGR